MLKKSRLYTRGELSYNDEVLWWSPVLKRWFCYDDRTTLSKPYLLISFLRDDGYFTVEAKNRPESYDKIFQIQIWNMLDLDTGFIVRKELHLYLGTFGTLYGDEFNNYSGRMKSQLADQKDEESLHWEDIKASDYKELSEDRFITFAGKQIY